MDVDTMLHTMFGQPERGRHRLFMIEGGPPGAILLELVAHGQRWELLLHEDTSLIEVEDLTCPHCRKPAVDR